MIQKKIDKKDIHCCECDGVITAYLTNGKEIYPHREDLKNIPFWKCEVCKNYVGCHHKTDNPTRPLGIIPNKELRNARQYIHAILDPLWKNKSIKRNFIYKKISEKLGWKYHTACIRNVNEARKVYSIILSIKKGWLLWLRFQDHIVLVWI